MLKAKPFKLELLLSQEKDSCPTTLEDLQKISALLNIFAVTVIFEKEDFQRNPLSTASERMPTSYTNLLLQLENGTQTCKCTKG